MNLETVDLIASHTRRRGNTEYILRAVINDPAVIIVCGNVLDSNRLRAKYFEMLKQAPWYKRLVWFFAGRAHPTFIAGRYVPSIVGRKEPVVFDNRALQYE